MRLSVEDSIALLQPQKSEVLGRVRHRYEKSNPGEGHLSSQVGAPGKMMLPLCISPNPKVEKVSSQPCTWSGIECPRIFLSKGSQNWRRCTCEDKNLQLGQHRGSCGALFSLTVC